YIKVDNLTNLDGITNAEEQEPYQKFFLGEAMMVPRGPWVVPEGEAEYGLTYGEDFEFVSMPFYGPDKKFAAETGWGLAVNSATKNEEAAWKFVEFWSQKERLLAYNIATATIPPYKSLAHDPSFVEALPYMAPIVDVLDGGQFIGHFNTSTLKEEVSNMFVDIIDNGTSVEDAVKALDDIMNNQ
ncbi:MAG: extracellular solute-binding protein, partial [Actinomycetia bacterium]|nr:extracellular solute-binding protein [Actinomycetes bacterium]